jgi:ABC-type transporter Mla subunit MlaD
VDESTVSLDTYLKDLLNDIQVIGNHASQLIGELEDNLTDHGETSLSDILKQIHDETKDMSDITKSLSDTVKNITKFGKQIETAVKFAEGLGETVGIVSGVDVLMKTETVGEIAAAAAIAVVSI